MLKRTLFILFYLLLLLPGVSGDGFAAATLPHTIAPIRFIENQGQWAEAVRFQATTADGVLWLTDDALWVSKTIPDQGQINIRLTFTGQNAAARLEPFARQETVISYFRGSDPEQWHGAVPVWGGVRIRDLYPGVDLVLRGENGRLQPEFVGAAGEVTMQVEGVDEVSARGRELHFRTAAATITWPLPITSHPLTLEITTPATHHAPRTLHLNPAAGTYQTSPSFFTTGSALLFGTYIGGEDVLPDVPNASAVDSQGNVYSTGYTESPIFPNEPGLTPLHGIDVIITKLLADGSDLAYAIHINPSAFNQPDYGYGILVNASGEAYVVGETNSFDFPTTPDALDATFDEGDAFFFKVAANGASLLYSTFLGGSDLDGIRGIARDAQGNFYLTGQTWSTDYPVTTCLNPPASCHKGVRDVFVTKLNAAGTAILYSTLLGGTVQEQGQGIVVDSAGQATITGWTNSNSYPTTSGAYDETFNGEFDVFVTKINATGTALVYSTFLGGDNEDRADAITLHNNNIIVTGTTLCPCPNPFPTTPGAYDTSHNGDYDGFVAELASNGSSLVFSTFLGGAAEDRGHGLTLTSNGEIAVTGTTHSSGVFPLTPDAFDNTLGGPQDAFLTVLNGSGSQVIYSSYLGGSVEDEGAQVVMGSQGTFILAGSTRSTDFPVTPGAYNTTLNGDYDIFVVRLALEFVPPEEELTYLPLAIRQ